MNLPIRRLVGKIAGFFCPQYSTCGRCGRPWNVCNPHYTHYLGRSAGCFPLCQDCWQELTPEERIPYYYRLVAGWIAQADGDDHRGQPWSELWSTLEENVLAGL